MLFVYFVWEGEGFLRGGWKGGEQIRGTGDEWDWSVGCETHTLKFFLIRIKIHEGRMYQICISPRVAYWEI